MRAAAKCLACIVNKQEATLPAGTDEETRSAYIREAMGILSHADPRDSAPVLIARLLPLYESYFGDRDPYEEIKQRFNALLLGQIENYERDILSDSDPLKRALCLARAGNYIDSASEHIPTEEKLEELLAKAVKEEISPEIYDAFRQDLERANSLLYITDNAGEIVLDLLCIRQIQRAYPQLSLAAMVRGGPVLNDATMADARQIGLTELCSVIDSGVRVAGTDLRSMPMDARQYVEKADLILAKGQANFESLFGSGLPVYYSFLCKCSLFVERFALPAYSGIFARESDIRGMTGSWDASC